MGRTDILKKLIVQHSPNIKAFSVEAGLPYSTLRSMLERGIGNASVDNVIKVCKALGITIEELEEMNDTNINKFELLDEEISIIKKYRDLDNKGKHTVETVLNMEYNRCSEDQSIPLAAHDREDINVSEQDKQHDIDIMKDDNEW